MQQCPNPHCGEPMITSRRFEVEEVGGRLYICEFTLTDCTNCACQATLRMPCKPAEVAERGRI